MNQKELLYTADRVIEFRHPYSHMYYICYVITNSSHTEMVIFEWYKRTSAQLNVVADVTDFIIRKIIDGYKITSVIKSRDGKKSIKNNIFEKYYKLLRLHYHSNETLDGYFRQFIYAVFVADIEGLRLIMIDINTHLGQFN